MNRLLILFAIVLISCGEKKEVVTEQNLQDVLTRYGQAHPENEVIIETQHGTMKIRLYEDTPLHRANFVKLINEDYFDGGTFYRIVSKFMIQGGVKGKSLDYLVPSEFRPNHFHKRGAVAMAHFDQERNPELKSSPTEFYIMQGQIYSEEDVADEERERGMTMTPEQKEAYMTVGGDFSLDQKYTVFGEVVEGFDVIGKIASERVHQEDKPINKIAFKISVAPR